MEQPKLIHCPFCGSVDTLSMEKEIYGGKVYNTAVCMTERGGCGTSSGWYLTPEEAAAAWNRRAGLMTVDEFEALTDEQKEALLAAALSGVAHIIQSIAETMSPLIEAVAEFDEATKEAIIEDTSAKHRNDIDLAKGTTDGCDE